MKQIFLSVVFALAIGSVFGQQDQKAKEILDNVTQKTQACKSIEANFSFDMENVKEHIKETKTGTIILKGNKYKLNLNELGLEVYSDGKTIWTYMKESNEVNVSNFDGEKSEMMDPSKVFTIYQKGFNYKFVQEATVGGKAVYVINLIPQKADMEYKNITLNVDKAKMLISSAKMQGKDGNMYTVSVSQYKTDGVFDDKIFVFDKTKHPKVEVVDMR